MDLTGVSDLAELSEAEYRIRLHERSSAQVREALGMDGARIGGGVALAVRNEPSGAWTRALGLGITQPLTSGLLDEVTGFFRSAGVTAASIQIAPRFLPSDWDRIAGRAQLVDTGSAMLKLAGRPERSTAPPPESLRIAPVPADRVREAVGVLLRGIGLPAEGLVDMLAGSVDGTSSTVWAAWAGEQIVATSIFWIDREVAYFAGMATLPEHRGQGAQTGLIAAQMTLAAEAGCQWAFVDVVAPVAGGTNTSLTNFLRHGFEPLHRRANWRWTQPHGR